MKGLLLLSLLVALAAPTQAAAPSRGVAEPAGSPAEREHWVERLRDAQAELGAARERYDRALESYRRMRHRPSMRGEKRVEVGKERDEARAALHEAERSLEQLLESARRAGVPPGWIRDALEPEPASPAP